MTKFQKIALLLLRLALGWLFFWSGITKVLNPSWSAAGFLNAAHTFPMMYHWFASPALLSATNFINAWGQLILGVSLILGVYIRWTAPFGILLMALYYFAVLQFPYPNATSFIVDEHVIYAAALLILMAFRADKSWSLVK